MMKIIQPHKNKKYFLNWKSFSLNIQHTDFCLKQKASNYDIKNMIKSKLVKDFQSSQLKIM